MLDFLLYRAPFLAVESCGLVFGLRALSRHGTAAILTTIGWGLLLLTSLLSFFVWNFFGYSSGIQLLMNFLLYPGATIMILLGILSMLTPRASNPTLPGMPSNSTSAFQYQGLNLHAEGDQS
ncbi:MAG: hypothetical protein VB855_17450 [Pirellulaceae bacterium]